MSNDDDANDGAEELLKGDALIRANFHIDPGELTPEKWAKLFAQAIWLENFRLQNTAKLLAQMHQLNE